MTTFFEDVCLSVDRPVGRAEEGVPFWRSDPPVIDAKGQIIRGGMLPHQKAFWDLPNFVKVLVGGYGSGKTNCGCKRILSLALMNAPCPVAVVSPTFQIARRTVIQTIMELLSGKQSIYGRRLHWRYNGSLHEFMISLNGREGRIYICSGDRPISLRGPNIAAALIDEPFIQDIEVFTQMMARVRHPQAVRREICMAGTPEQLNWGYDLCLGELSSKIDVGMVQASTRLNYALPSDYVARLEGVFPDRAADAFIEGRFTNLSSGQVYYAFDPLESVIDLEMPDYAELGVGMDFNVNPMAAVVFWYVGRRMHIFDELELPNADTEHMCTALREKYVLPEQYKRRPLVNVYPDASGAHRHSNAPGGRSDFHFIREAGFVVNAKLKNPPIKDRLNAVNGKFKAKDGGATLTVSSKCKRLIKYLSVYTHELLHKEEQKRMSHLLDAMGYPVHYLFPVNSDQIRVYKLAGV